MDGSGGDTRAGSRIRVARVTVYAIAQLRFADRAAYDRYPDILVLLVKGLQ